MVLKADDRFVKMYLKLQNLLQLQIALLYFFFYFVLYSIPFVTSMDAIFAIQNVFWFSLSSLSSHFSLILSFIFSKILPALMA